MFLFLVSSPDQMEGLKTSGSEITERSPAITVYSYSLLHNCVAQRIAHGVAFAFELE